jgi:hypothetical protein
MPCPEEYAHSTTKHCDFQGITAGYKSNLLKDQQTKFALQQKKCNNTANRRGPDCFICCGRRTSKGFAKRKFQAYISPKVGNYQLSYTNHYSRALSAGSHYLNNPTKEYFFKVRLIRKSFSTELCRTRVRQNKTN